jgi:hypothetical protein
VKSFSRLVTLGAVASGAGGILLAVFAPTASASPSVSLSNTLISIPETVGISAHIDPLNTAVLYFNGSPVASLNSPVSIGKTLSYNFSSAGVGNGTYPVEVVEKTAGLSPLTQRAYGTVTVALHQAQSAAGGSSSGSSGSGSSASHSGAVSNGSAGGASGASGASSASGAGAPSLAASNAAAPAGIGYFPPGSGGTGFGSSYSRMDALAGSSSLVLPNVAQQGGFQLPIKPDKQANLADSPARGNSLTAATWLIGLALGFIMLLTALHTGRWARKRHQLSTAAATSGRGAGKAGGGPSITTSAGSGGDAAATFVMSGAPRHRR